MTEKTKQPQSTRISSKRIAISLIFLVALLSAVAFWRLGATTAASPEAKSIPVTVKVAEQRTVSNSLSALATVQAVNTVVVHSRVDGLVERVVFQEGHMVRRGDVLVELDHRPFDVQVRAARAQLKKDSAQRDNARQDVTRYEFLVKTDSVATQALDTARAQLAQLAAAVEADQTQIDQAQLQLEYATIRSPINGRLGARLVDAGNVIHISDANGLVVVSQLRPAVVSFALPQVHLSALREHQKDQRRGVQALDTSGKAIANGDLTFIDSQIDAATGTIRCKATFPNDDEALWPGAFVNVRIVLGDIPDAILVPSAAVQAGAQQPYVYIVTAKSTVEMRNVVAGSTIGDETVIASGLHAGERVVTEGQFQLENGARITVRPPASDKPPLGAAPSASPLGAS
jgi:multidrug efflux system membrane fusion protein